RGRGRGRRSSPLLPAPPFPGARNLGGAEPRCRSAGAAEPERDAAGARAAGRGRRARGGSGGGGGGGGGHGGRGGGGGRRGRGRPAGGRPLLGAVRRAQPRPGPGARVPRAAARVPGAPRLGRARGGRRRQPGRGRARGQPLLRPLPRQDPAAAQVRPGWRRAGAGGAPCGVSGAFRAAHCPARRAPFVSPRCRSDPAVFESRLEKRIEFRKQPVGHSRQGDFIKCVEQKTDTLGKQPLRRGFTKDKTLSSIFNIEMVKDKTAEEIKQEEKFDLIWNRAQSCPTFLCALPRREGYEFFVGQWTGAELHFTALINIQTRGEAAASQLILYHYPELKEEKGIVLMTAEMDSTFLNVAEAQCIANQVQLFYATDRKETYALVETFNFRPNEFKYMSVIAELEQSGLGAELKCAQNQHKT
uniref:ATP synthase mitochondrial F1 complex assembly factor 1 n=1 Tax=Equus caballus TaxID=9796 RepID=A0A9L0R2V8_HORSE